MIFWSPHKKPAITGDKLFSCVCFWKWFCFFSEYSTWFMIVLTYVCYKLYNLSNLVLLLLIYLFICLSCFTFNICFFLLFLSYSFRLNLISLLIWFLYEKPTYTCFSDISDRVLFIFYFKIKVFDKSWS